MELLAVLLALLVLATPVLAISAVWRQRKLRLRLEELAQQTSQQNDALPEEELSELAIQSLEGYFRSHPQPSERLAQANKLIAQEGWQDRKKQKPFRIEYEVHNGQYVK